MSSSRGIKKAKVFPEPVSALTHTSLFPKKRGITAFYTLVGEVKCSSEVMRVIREVEIIGLSALIQSHVAFAEGV